MNPDTGEMREFYEKNLANKGFVALPQIHEVIEIHGCKFVVKSYEVEKREMILIEVLEAMERQVMDLTHPNFKELQKRIEGLEEKNRELLEENAKLIDYSQKLEAKLEKTVEVLKSIVNEYETLEKLEKDEDHNRPASYVLPIKKWGYIVCKEVLKEIEDGK